MYGPDAFSIMAQANHNARVQQEREWRLSRRPSMVKGQATTPPAIEAPAINTTWLARVRAALGHLTGRRAPTAIRSRLA